MISRRACSGVVVTLVLLSGVAGCASNPKQRVAMLEDANRRLTDQLNRMRGDLTTASGDVEELNRRLMACRQESDNLRAQLANAQTPVEAAPGWTAVPGGAMIVIETEVLFPSGKAVLRNEAQRTLDGIVSTLTGQYEGKDVFVIGHTDDQPIKKSGWKDNWELSTERSLAVVRYLQDHNVTAARLVAAGASMYRPVADNNGDRGRSRNRRVEIFAVDPFLLKAAK